MGKQTIKTKQNKKADTDREWERNTKEKGDSCIVYTHTKLRRVVSLHCLLWWWIISLLWWWIISLWWWWITSLWWWWIIWLLWWWIASLLCLFSRRCCRCITHHLSLRLQSVSAPNFLTYHHTNSHNKTSNDYEYWSNCSESLIPA